MQWAAAVLTFFFFSWLYMGEAITNCSTASIAFASDSTGGFAWFQWVSGNDLTWDSSYKSNYPFGEAINRPQFITSALVIGLFKVFASFTTPICGINLITLLGYMSSALLMFGLLKWLLKRVDIAFFAGYAAAFVPYHQLKAQSHITYVYGSLFIAIIWAFLWFISNPSYRRAALVAAISVLGFYFDGYFILISGVLIGALIGATLLAGVWSRITKRQGKKVFPFSDWRHLRYLLAYAVLLGMLLIPIAYTYKTNAATINQALSSARSSIRGETQTYGLRPIELVLPSFNNPLLDDDYPAWLATKLHGSNFHEATLFAGYTVLLLAMASIGALFFKKNRLLKIKDLPYYYIIPVITLTALICFSLSLPSHAYIFGRLLPTPTAVLTEFFSAWRVLARFFLALHPLLVLLASLGVFVISQNWSSVRRTIFTLGLMSLLFIEFLPSPLGKASDLQNDSPAVYRRLESDNSVNVIAEYPIASFSNSPAVFTYQQLHKKTLLNANNAEIIKGPIHASIAGLNDPQTIGALKKMGVDVVTTYGYEWRQSGLETYFPNGNGERGVYSYRLGDNVKSKPYILIMTKGYESLSVDHNQISHRAITGPATMEIFKIWSGKEAGKYNVNFSARAIVCETAAKVSVGQGGETLWNGEVTESAKRINFLAEGSKPIQITPTCSLDITHMSAEKVEG